MVLKQFPSLLIIALLLPACTIQPVDDDKTIPEPAILPAPKPTPIILRHNHPDEYVVQPDDTLLDVANVFLKHPWQWAQLWHPDPEEESRDLQSGQLVTLSHRKGRPVLHYAKGGAIPIIKLRPRVREVLINQTIPPIPRDAVAGFLENATVVTPEVWHDAPHVISGDDGRTLLGTWDQIYVIGELTSDFYQVFRSNGEYRDPETGDYLGHAGTYLGDAVLAEKGEPAVFTLASVRKPIRPGDRLLPPPSEIEPLDFEPRAAPPHTRGTVIALLGDSVSTAARYQTVAINLGRQQRMKPGYMLELDSRKQVAMDPVTGKQVAINRSRKTGLIMLYRTYDHISLGLITEMTNSPIRVGDTVHTPVADDTF